MSEKTEAVPLRTAIKTGVANFIQKNRTGLIVAIVTIIVGLVGLAIWTQIDNGIKVEYAAKVEKVQSDYDKWKAESDATKKKELETALDASFAQIIKDAPLSYGLIKTIFLQASFFTEEKKWGEAAKAFHSVFEKDPKSYLAPSALINAAVSYEYAGDDASALGTYAELLKNFPSDKVLVPQAHFSQARILESQNKTKEALESYKNLTDKFPESSWTKLARGRIIVLGTE